jgi:hypothetical protein
MSQHLARGHVPGLCGASWGRSGRRGRHSHRGRTWDPKAFGRGRIGRCQTGVVVGSSLAAGRGHRSRSGRDSWRRRIAGVRGAEVGLGSVASATTGRRVVLW